MPHVAVRDGGQQLLVQSSKNTHPRHCSQLGMETELSFRATCFQSSILSITFYPDDPEEV